MRHDLFNPQLLPLSIALTVAALIGQALLPPRTLELTARDTDRVSFLATTGEPGAGNPVQWVDESRWQLRCDYKTPATYQPCGLTFMLTGADATHGLDLRRFESLELDLTYSGSLPTVRVAIRNFDPRFSKVEDANSARIHTINLRARDVGQPVQLDLSELTVPEWWVSQYQLPHEFNRPRLDNATSVTIDLPGDLTGRVQELQLHRLVLKGEWLARETVYLAILSLWLLGASASVLRRVWELGRRDRRQQREIDALTARTRQLRLDQDRLRRLTTIDELTGVLNRRGLEAALQDLEAQADGVVLIVLDIDHFKTINDRWGHAVGDQVLRRVAAIVAANLRASDVVGRWGGEEFVVACQGRHVDDAARLAEKLRHSIENGSVDAKDRFSVTASFGAALAPPGTPVARAFKRADAALYRAKREGRNRVEVDTANDAVSTL